MAIEYAARIARIPAYPVAGGYALPDEVALLASNESPEPPLPEVLEVIARASRAANRYPDPSYGPLRRALADRYGIGPAHVAVGNGSVEILLAAGEALLEPGAELVHAWPSFSVYPHLEAASGATAVRVPLDGADRHDLDAMLAEITVATRMVIVCNPNNPTSTAHPPEAIRAFVERVPAHVAVLLDEAYIEFAELAGDPDASLALLAEHPNLVILRTFSKLHGLAGLRVGFALSGSERFVQAVHQVRQPFCVSAIAQAAATEALRHGDRAAERVERAIVARVEMEEGLRAMGLRVAESQANFCWVHLPGDVEEAAVVAGLRERGVLVRAGAALGQEGRLRVTYGRPGENARFLAALRDLVGSTAG